MKKRLVLGALILGMLTIIPSVTHAEALDTEVLMDTSMGIVEADVTAPTVTGLKGLSVVNEDTDLSKNVPASTDICTFTNKNVTLKITDPSGVKSITLNDVECVNNEESFALAKPIENGYQIKVTFSNSYILGVEDMLGNTAYYRFVIDKKKPVIKVYDDAYMQNGTRLIANNQKYTRDIDRRKDLSKQLWFSINPEIYAADGFNFSDDVTKTKGIKSVTINGVEVDLSNPTLLDQDEDFAKIEKGDYLGFPILLPATKLERKELVGEPYDERTTEHILYLDQYFPEDGKYVIKVTDLAGNVAQKTINIDRTAPVVTVTAKKGTLYEDVYGSTVFDAERDFELYVNYPEYRRLTWTYEPSYSISCRYTNKLTLSWKDNKDVVSAQTCVWGQKKNGNWDYIYTDVDIKKDFIINVNDDEFLTLIITDKSGNKTYIRIDRGQCTDEQWQNRLSSKYTSLTNHTYLKWKKTK